MNYEYFYQRFRWLLYNYLNFNKTKSQDLTYSDFFPYSELQPDFGLFLEEMKEVNIPFVTDSFVRKSGLNRDELHTWDDIVTEINSKGKKSVLTTNKFGTPLQVLLKDFRESNFEISKSLIKKYDDLRIHPFIPLLKNNEIKHGGYNGFTQSFIERLKDPLNPQSRGFLDEIKQRIILFRWWDLLDTDELIFKVIKYHFLDSTRKMIGDEKLILELRKRYKNKDILLEDLFRSFDLSCEIKIKRLKTIRKTSNEDFLKHPFYKIEDKKHPSRFYEYNNLFRSEFEKSIRTWENEIRMDFGLKISGTRFNEDLLFKTVFQIFGDRYKVVSQGSPSWLKPQKFDIYFPELNIAIEYQGEQHFRPVNFSGRGDDFALEQFEQNQKRDELKRKKCVDNGCILLEMRYDDDMDEFISLVEKVIYKK